jgi:polyhydroxyalkanoate synthesis regulator phasin
MKDFLRKAWFFGLGVLDATKEKVEAVVGEMVKRGEVTLQESPQAVEQILSKAQEAQKALVDKIKKSVGDMKLARAADLQALEKRLAALEKKIKAKPKPKPKPKSKS